MKKICILLTSLIVSMSSMAQLFVSHDGGTEVNNLYAKTIYTNPGDTATSTGTKTAIEGRIYDSKYAYAIGLSGYAAISLNNYSTTRHAIGVKGQANYASGMNFGVYGVVAPPTGSGYLNYGAGVYGTTKTSLKTLSGRYAGYFDGYVGVNGNMSVSGTVNGVVISRGISSNDSRSSSVTDESSIDAASCLSGLQISSFYFDQPENERVTMETSNTGSRDDSQSSDNENQRNVTEMQVFSKKHFALNANQLETVFPDLVYENEDGTKSINYVEMVPILVQAINELQSQVNELKGEKEGAVKKATGISDTPESVQLLFLGQNKPNPFSTATDIEVSVPENVQTAFLYVYDLQGKEVQQVDITARGKQTIKVDAADLAEGMYLYSLIADGKVVETRRMIVEK